MAIPEAAGQEATILSLSFDLNMVLRDFRERLDNKFNRVAKCDEGKPERPVTINVLDEIIENLTSAEAELSSIMSFVSSDVLPKIS